MSLMQLQRVDFSIGGPLLLEHVDLTLEPNERVCIVGRNGAGKSTLMRLLAGELTADDGEVRLQAGVVVARMAQEVPQGTEGTVFDVVAEGLGDLGHLLAQYHHALHDGDMEAMGNAQEQIEAQHGWDLDLRVQQVLTKLELPEDADFAALSGGMKRRVLLAQALVRKPDILLLDEPTNHLDIDAIAWLEGFLKQFEGSIVFVTHDRSFLRALATRIIEIDRGQVTSWPGDYENYLRRREERLHAEAQENQRFDKLLAQEEIWIRQGIKARRTRNEGRVTALKALRRERSQRRDLGGNVRMEVAAAQNSGKKVIEIKGITQAYDGRVLLDNVSTTIMRGDRVGIIGPNGAGKSTTIGIICSLVIKTAGRVEVFGIDIDRDFAAAKRLIGVVPQEFNFSIFEQVGDIVETQAGFYGLRQEQAARQTEKYLRKLGLWDKRNEQARHLSGGMKRRLMIARALVHEPRLLILDEPTAGVDIEIRRSMWSFLREMNEAGTTIILTTHYLEEAESLCRNIAIIDHGEIVENTTMRELLQQLKTETLVLDLAEPLTEAPELAPYGVRRIEPTRLEVDIAREQDLNEVFQRLDAVGIRVRSMRNKSNRLEQLFVALTQSEGSAETLVHAAG